MNPVNPLNLSRLDLLAGKRIPVVVAECDIPKADPDHNSRGPICWETYIAEATEETARKQLARLGNAYGDARIAYLTIPPKVSPLEQAARDVVQALDDHGEWDTLKEAICTLAGVLESEQ